MIEIQVPEIKKQNFNDRQINIKKLSKKNFTPYSSNFT